MFKEKIKEYGKMLLRIDPVLLLLMVFLLAVSCIFIYSTGVKSGVQYSHRWLLQIFYIIIGSGAFITLTLLDYHFLGKWSWLIYLFGLGLILLTFFFGSSNHGQACWLPIGPINVQPSELAKPATLLFMAWVASLKIFHGPKEHFLIPVLVVASPPILLVCLQPDWGTAMVFFPMTAVVLFLAGIRWRWVFAVLFIILITAIPAYKFVLKPHQQKRIATFINPANADRDQRWNIDQSMLAVGSGGFAGKGFLNGDVHSLGFLPHTIAPTDFIFSVIAEESGFIGSMLVVMAFLGLLLCCLRTASVASDDFGAYLAVGVAAIFFVHIYINIGMTIMLAPIIGIPLPFVSFGGSFVVSSFICAGLLQSVHVRRV